MTPEVRRRRDRRGMLRVIALFKFVKAALVGGISLGALRLFRSETADRLRAWAVPIASASDRSVLHDLLAHLGEIENPIDRRMTIDLGAAKQLIDILGILKDKTKGNLDASEAGLLDNMLYDLRLRYVERVRSRSEKA